MPSLPHASRSQNIQPLPILLLRRGEVRPRALTTLLDDPRFEFIQVRRLSREWRSLANHVTATFVATDQDPLDALTYALTGGVTSPIVVLVPKRRLRDAGDALAAGAIACMAVPVSAADRDRLARLLRRAASPARVDATLRLLLDPISRTVWYRRKHVSLSQREFALLYCLSTQSGRPIAADELLRRVWQNVSLQSRQRLDVYVYQLRRKLGALGLADAIATVRSYGYTLAASTRRGGRAARVSAARAGGPSRPR